MNHIVALVLAILSAGLAWSPSDSSRTVYVSVIDKNRAPVRGLGAADFAISEDGRACSIVRVERATQPLHVAIGGDWYSELGDVKPLEAFITALLTRNPATQIALKSDLRWTSDGVRLNAGLDQGARRRSADHSSASISELHRLADAFNGGTESRQTIVMLFDERLEELDGTELGLTRAANSLTVPTVLEPLQAAGVAFWAIVHAPDGALQPDNTTFDLRRTVYQDVTARTGGLWLDAGLDAKSETRALLQIADLLDAQYAITYAGGDDQGRAALKVTTSRAGARVLAPAVAPVTR